VDLQLPSIQQIQEDQDPVPQAHINQEVLITVAKATQVQILIKNSNSMFSNYN
jgi:hypothetical protein